MAVKIKKVLVSVPEPLLKKLDAVARRQDRDRSSELCRRLAESLKAHKAGKVERSGQDRRSASQGA